MPYLMRMNVRPNESTLKAHELEHLQRVFDIYSAEVRMYGESIGWREIDEVELVEAPGVRGIGGWIIDRLTKPEPTYHLGIYLGREEAVLANLSMSQALYVLSAIAYYAPNPIRYKGPDGIVPVTQL